MSQTGMFLSDVSKLTTGSRTVIQVKCQFNVVDTCVGIYKIQYKAALKNIERNNGKYSCFHCSMHLKFSGSGNPNCTYNFDRNLMSKIDTEAKAYLLGWISSDGCIPDTRSWRIRIAIKNTDIKCLENLRDIVCKEIPIKDVKNDMVSLVINSKQMCQDVCRHLKIARGKKSSVVKFPDLDTEDLSWAFIRGVFDGDGTIYSLELSPTPVCSIASNSNDMLTSIGNFSKIPYKIASNKLNYCGANSVNFLSKLYANSSPHLRLERKYDLYICWLSWVKMLYGTGNSKRFSHFWVYKTDVNAILPSKLCNSNVECDLTIIKEEKRLDNDTVLYNTGIKVSMHNSHYVEIVQTSSLSDSGYILADRVITINHLYRGNIFIPLTKVDKTLPDIQLPFKCCQMIVRKYPHAETVEADEEFDESENLDEEFDEINENLDELQSPNKDITGKSEIDV